MNARWSTQVKTAVIIGLLLAAAWLFNRFHALLAPLATTLIVAYLLNLPVGVLTRRTGLSRTLSAAVVFLAALLALILIPTLFGRSLAGQIAALEIDLALQQALERLAGNPIEFLTFQIDLRNMLEEVIATLSDLTSPLASSAFNLVANAAQVVGWLIFVMVVAYLLVKDAGYFSRVIDERLPASFKPDAYRLAGQLGEIWDAFLRGRLVLSVAVGVVAVVVLSVLGMPNALALGAITGALTFIPSIGPFLAGAVVSLLALLNGSTYLDVGNLAFALLVAGIYFVMFQIESMYLQPSIIGRHVRLHPVVVIVGTVAGALTAGILGIFLAAPIIASARVLLGYVYHRLLDLDPFPPLEEALPAPAVERRGVLRGRVVEAVLFDLDGTLVETDDRMVARVAARLGRFRRLLPGRDPQRAARRLVMLFNDWINGLLALLDRVGWDRAAQRLARRVGLIEDHAGGRRLVPVPRTVALLRELDGRYRLGIVSTRRAAEIEVYLQQAGLEGNGLVVAGFDTTERIKPHPQPVLWAAAQLGVDPHGVVMVGDTAVDVRAAKAAGALAVGVLCGFGEARDLDQADLILKTTADLADYL